MKKAVLFLVSVLALTSMFAQNAEKKTSIGVGFSLIDFSGPVTDQYFMFDRHTGALNLSVSRYLSKTFDVRANLTYGTIWHPTVTGYPNIIKGNYTQASLWDLGFNGILKFNNGSILKENARFAPYLYTGLGINIINGIGKVGVNDDINTYIPAGIGMNVRINEMWPKRPESMTSLASLK